MERSEVSDYEKPRVPEFWTFYWGWLAGLVDGDGSEWLQAPVADRLLISCSAPLRFGQPFVLIRLFGCIGVGGIGEVRGI